MFWKSIALGLAWGVSGCLAPMDGGERVSWHHEEWGHRPGPRGFTTVVIDAGHGGSDSGAVSVTTGSLEKDLALDTARRLKQALSGRLRVVMTRNRDRFIELDERVRRASGRDGAILVSLHYNAGRSHQQGPETYFWRVDSHGLAVRVQREMERVTPDTSGNRGLVRRRLRLTRNPDIPSVLVECGYLSHPAEARRCDDPSFRQAMADALARAILAQQRSGDAGTGSRPAPRYDPPSRATDPPGS